MALSYNHFAGKNLDRIVALSDGVFAFAMTLLVLDLHRPVVDTIRSEQDLWHALPNLGPSLLTYVMSFLTLGIFWLGQQAQCNLMARSDRDFAWLHIAFLVFITLIPFSTALLSAFIRYKIALVEYWLNIVVLGALLAASWWLVRSHGLLKEDVPAGVHAAIVERIVSAQALYAAGALFCLIDNWLSIGFIFAVQLAYALGLAFRPFR